MESFSFLLLSQRQKACVACHNPTFTRKPYGQTTLNCPDVTVFRPSSVALCIYCAQVLARGRRREGIGGLAEKSLP